MAVRVAIAGDVFDGVLFCAVLFSRDILDEIWERTESVPENYPSYSCESFFVVVKRALIAYPYSLTEYKNQKSKTEH